MPTANLNRLNSCLSDGRSARLLPAQQQCLFATRPTRMSVAFREKNSSGVPDSESEASSKLLKIMIWCCVVHSEVGHCWWNCQCEQMYRYTAEVRGDRSIPLGTETKREVWLLRTGFGIAPVNKLVSLTWLLWALRSFRSFTLHYITGLDHIRSV